MIAPDDGTVARISSGIRAEVDGVASELIQLSAAIHANPELRFAEHMAAARVSDVLQAHGFALTRGIAGLPTAFRAEHQVGAGDGPTIAIFSEYDALPGLGHGCGHNIIAAAGVGAALSAVRWLQSAGTREFGASGRVVLFGSPGEEGGGGKVFLVEDGQLDDVDAAMMIHPAGYDAVGRTNLGRISLEARFTGRASHASAAPEFGRNALDAATLLLVAIGLLRQQLRDSARIHAIIDSGGDSINVIPESSTVKIFIRAEDADYLRGRMFAAVRDCVHGAGLATGTTAVLEEVAKAYEPVLRNPVLAQLTEQAFRAAGRPLDPAAALGGAGSTDMGNVSQRVPAIHPYIQVTPGIPLHTADFVTAADSVDAQRAIVDGAAVIGTVAATLLCRPDLISAARAAFADGSAI